MIIAGIITMVAGVISYVVGNSMNSSIKYQLEGLLKSGQLNRGDIFITIGIIVFVVGVALLGIGIYRNKMGK